MKIAHIILLLLIVVTSSCKSNDRKTTWLEFSRDRNATCFYTLEKLSRDETGRLAKVWVKTLFNEIRHQGDDEVAYAKNLFIIKCQDKTYRINAGFYYNSANEIVSKTDEEQSREMTMLLGRTDAREAGTQPASGDAPPYIAIAPGSPVDHLREKVCR